jgi:hypothetical protein
MENSYFAVIPEQAGIHWRLFEEEDDDEDE